MSARDWTAAELAAALRGCAEGPVCGECPLSTTGRRWLRREPFCADTLMLAAAEMLERQAGPTDGRSDVGREGRLSHGHGDNPQGGV